MANLGHPSKFQRVSRLGSVTARHSSSGRQPNFAALNRGRHLYSAGRPSGWALAHISSDFYLSSVFYLFSPNLSGRRLDVYYTSTHGVAIRIYACLKMCYTRLAEDTGRKQSPSQHHRTTLSGHIFATAYIDNRKEVVKHQYLLHMFS